MFKNIKNIYNSSRLALVIYFLIFAMILLCTAIYGAVSVNTVKKEAYAKNSVLLDKIMANLENEFSHMEAVILEFIRANIVFNPVDLHIEDDFERYRLHKGFSQFIETNPYVESIYVYYHGGKKVYYQTARTSGTIDAADFHDNTVYAGFQENLHASGFTSERLLEPDYFKKEEKENKAAAVISFCKSLPMNSLNTDNAIIVNLKEDHLNSMAQKNIDLIANTIIVSDMKRNTVLSFSDNYGALADVSQNIRNASATRGKNLDLPSSYSQVIGREKYFIINAISDGQRIYTIVLPESKLLEPVDRINRIMLIFSGVVLFIGIILSLTINRKYFTPVLGILHKLESAGEKTAERTDENIFSQIKERIDGILKEKSVLEISLREYFSLPAAGKRRRAASRTDSEKPFFDDKTYTEQLGINNKELIQKVIDYIEEHFMDNIGLDTIARQVYFSPDYLGKVFKEISGVTFSEYLIGIRMKAAAGMLIKSSMSITSIAQNTGYSTHQSFSKAFRNFYHCSPVEYRKRCVADRL